MNDFSLKTALSMLPDQPGVYLMKDKKDEIIYVGKAKSLKNRVRSYFQSKHDHEVKVKALVKNIVSFETIVVDSSLEALVLEANLIKKYRPKYNIQLKDDKNYPYLKITLREKFPRMMVVRRVTDDGSRYFGPFTDGKALKEATQLLEKIFPLRTCRQRSFKEKQKGCLNYQIGKCKAPCEAKISVNDYQQMVQSLLGFLEGKTGVVLKELENKMWGSVAKQEYEAAARYRDQIEAVKKITTRQRINSNNGEEQDMVAVAVYGQMAVIQVFFIREGKVTGRKHFHMENIMQETKGEILQAFIKEFYLNRIEIPSEIFVSINIPEKELLTAWLRKKCAHKIRIHNPQRGDKARLMRLVSKNAEYVLNQELVFKEKKKKQEATALEELKKVIKLGKTPYRIECYDISHIQGTHTVGSMVVFLQGKPAGTEYRYFKIKEVQGVDDFASLQEVLKRRLQRIELNLNSSKEKTGFSAKPDLLVIDGGKGQLSAVKKIIDEAGWDIAVCSLAKREEELFLPEQTEAEILTKEGPAYHLLQKLRDEAHRFAITQHRKLRGKDQVKSELDDISQIGPSRKKILLKAYDNDISQIKTATLDELKNIEGLGMLAAENVYTYFQKKGADNNESSDDRF